MTSTASDGTLAEERRSHEWAKALLIVGWAWLAMEALALLYVVFVFFREMYGYWLVQVGWADWDPTDLVPAMVFLAFIGSPVLYGLAAYTRFHRRSGLYLAITGSVLMVPWLIILLFIRVEP
jgi:hypothetical protein